MSKSNDAVPKFEDIDRMVSNPFFSNSCCPFRRKYIQTRECAKGVTMAINYLTKKQQQGILNDIMPKFIDISCPICRVKAYIIGLELAESCNPDIMPLFESAILDVDLTDRRPFNEIYREMRRYFDVPV